MPLALFRSRTASRYEQRDLAKTACVVISQAAMLNVEITVQNSLGELRVSIQTP